MRGLDFSSWRSLLATLLGLALVTLIGVGLRILTMVTIQQRRERVNRQINERLKTLISAYKTLGGSFTGDLTVDPAHKRNARPAAGRGAEAAALSPGEPPGSDRARRIRDVVEGALSDIILLGTEEQVRLAARAAEELASGRPVHTHDLVVSLRDFIRQALDLAPVPRGLVLPRQGPARPSGGGGGKGEGGRPDSRGGGGGAGGGGAGVGAGPDGSGTQPGDPEHAPAVGPDHG